MDYKSIIEAPYNRKNWQELMHDIFTSRIKFYDPHEVQISTDTAKNAYYLGKITLADGKIIAVYEVQLSDNVVIERNKVSIRNLLVQHWKNNGFSGAFMFCHKDTDSVLRFSYVSEILAFNEYGKLETNKTDTKRFTYYLGEGHRSRTAIDQFTKLKSSGQTLNDITKAFSIEALSDSFFSGYKNIYEDIVEYMTGKRMSKVSGKWEEVTIHNGNQEIVSEFASFDNPLKAMRDYVKKLLGRLVFLQFIQKKGWLGVKKNNEWGTGDKEFLLNLFINSIHKEDFIEKVLEPLFNDINTQRKDDLVSDKNVGTDIKVPFLNGGLFERDKEDENTIKLPSKYFKELFDFFSQYNFTIDENDPNDTEVGVDPEMLGRIFENLLEDNKDKGAFYTPKEIVRYMCAESLIAYLQSDITDDTDKESIRNFISTHEVSYLNDTLISTVKQKLKDVKICDPAIGSGAFPIGLLNELFACFEALEGEQANRAEIKKHIIQNSIYGVDIEKGAVDIARLRFWLSLVVDEDKPDALPNLDFKIMQGNSLLEQYQGIDLSELLTGKKLNMQMDIFDANLNHYRSNLNSLIKDYFNTKDYSKKFELKKQIQQNVNEQMKAADIDVDFNSLGIDIAGNDQFFLWHTWFTDVFNTQNGCNGFDIVIGNPPYVQLQNNGGELGNLYRHCKYKTFNSMGDLYSLFYEKGWQILKEGGFLCFITSNKWMRAGYGKETRDFFVNHTNPIQLIDFAGVKIFDSATVDTNILLFENATYKGKTMCTITKGESKISLQNLSIFVQQNHTECKFVVNESWVILSAVEQSIRNKIESVGTPLRNWNIQINYGIKTGCNEAFIIKTEKRDEILNNCNTEEERKRTSELLRPILRGRDIKRYGYEWADLWLINTHNGVKGKYPPIDINDYPAVKQHLDLYWDKINKRDDKGVTPYNLRNCAYLEDFEKQKIVYPETTQGAYFAFDNKHYYLDKTCFMLITNEAEYIQKTLSSKLIEYAYKRIFASVELGLSGYQYNKHAMVKLPIKILTEKEQEEFYRIDDLDTFMYKLYNLSYIEIKEIERNIQY